jgi:hypothetical protein
VTGLDLARLFVGVVALAMVPVLWMLGDDEAPHKVGRPMVGGGSDWGRSATRHVERADARLCLFDGVRSRVRLLVLDHLPTDVAFTDQRRIVWLSVCSRWLPEL